MGPPARNRQLRFDKVGGLLRGSLVGMPTRIGPTPVLPDEYLRHSAGTQRAFAVNLRFYDVAAPNDGYIAKMLHLGSRKFKPDQFSTLRVKLGGGLQHIGLVFPFLFAPAHDDSFWRHQFLEGLYVAGKPCAPYGHADTQQLLIIIILFLSK